MAARGWLLAFCLVWASQTASAQDTPATPVLRIEPGMHSARIIDAAMDQAGDLLVTGSDDKTARIWTLPELHPVRVLRPPIGQEYEGQVFAVAMTPDGKTAAVGGWLHAGQGQFVVDLFDVSSGRLIRQFEVDGSVAKSLAFTPEATGGWAVLKWSAGLEAGRRRVARRGPRLPGPSLRRRLRGRRTTGDDEL